jgi:hypothetical protein
MLRDFDQPLVMVKGAVAGNRTNYTVESALDRPPILRKSAIHRPVDGMHCKDTLSYRPAVSENLAGEKSKSDAEI